MVEAEVPLSEMFGYTTELRSMSTGRGKLALTRRGPWEDNTVVERFEEKMQRGGSAAILEAERFFMREDAVHRSLRNIAAKLSELNVPYAVAGGMALVAHGYDRTTVDVDVLIARDSLKIVHEKLEGLGYVAPFAGSKNLRDVETGVRIEFLVAGGFPGDGKPKPISFPDPVEVAVEIDGIQYIPLLTLIELKLASGLTNPGRVKDLADVQELIRVLKLPERLADQLNEYVRAKYVELWSGVAADEIDP